MLVVKQAIPFQLHWHRFVQCDQIIFYDLDVSILPVSKSNLFAQRTITIEQMNATKVSIHTIFHIMAHISPKIAPRLVRALATTCKYAECRL